MVQFPDFLLTIYGYIKKREQQEKISTSSAAVVMQNNDERYTRSLKNTFVRKNDKRLEIKNDAAFTRESSYNTDKESSIMHKIDELGRRMDTITNDLKQCKLNFEKIMQKL